MAWPLTPLKTFVARATVITAAFLNQVQATANDLFNGVISLKSLAVDGTGGAVVAPPVGSIQISVGGSSTTEGAAPLLAGAMYREGMAYGWAVASVDPITGVKTFLRGYNLRSITVNVGPPASYTVIFDSTVTSPTTACCVITPVVSGNSPVINLVSSDGGRVKVDFQILDAAGAPVFAGFHIVCFAY